MRFEGRGNSSHNRLVRKICLKCKHDELKGTGTHCSNGKPLSNLHHPGEIHSGIPQRGKATTEDALQLHIGSPFQLHKNPPLMSSIDKAGRAGAALNSMYYGMLPAVTWRADSSSPTPTEQIEREKEQLLVL